MDIASADRVPALSVIAAVLVLAGGCSSEGEGGDRGPVASPAASTGVPFDSEMRAVECQFTDNEAIIYAGGIVLAGGDRDAVSAAYIDFGRRLAYLALAPGGTDEFAEILAEWAGASAEVGEYIARAAKGSKIDYGPAYPKWVAAKKSAEKLCGHELPKRD